ncbi:MAG: TRAP transporter substrate-binding protein DctP [Thermodesulfobacteriota bacterium]
MDKKAWSMAAKALSVLSVLALLFTADLAVAQEKGKAVELRMATGAKPFQRFYKAVEGWMNRVEKGTNGTVKIKPFPSAQLYDYHELADPLMSGSIDLALATPGTFGKLAPCHALDWLDWGSPDLERGWAMLRKLYEHPDFLATIDGRFQELGVKLLYYVPNAVMRGPLLTHKPVRTLEDLKGLLIYAPSPNVAALVKALGTSTVFVPTGEVYGALERGTFQGALSLQELYLALKLYEKSKYLVDYTFNGGMMPFFVSLKAWNKLSKDTQKVMLDAAKQVQTEGFGTQVTFERGLEKGLAEKLEIIALAPEERARWDKAMMATHEKMAATDARTQKVWKLWNNVKSKP